MWIVSQCLFQEVKFKSSGGSWMLDASVCVDVGEGVVLKPDKAMPVTDPSSR